MNIKKIVTSSSLYKCKFKILEKKHLESMNANASNVLDLAHNSFIKGDIIYWLYAGTLLGFIRDNTFIKGDADIDLGVWASDILKVENLLIGVGFKKIHEFSYKDNIYEERYEYNGVGVDIFYFEKKNKSTVTYQFNRNFFYYPVREEHIDDDFDVLINKSFNGHIYKIPKEYEKILINTYGDWKTPLSREQGYEMFSASIHSHLRKKRAKIKIFNKSMHQISLFSLLFKCLKNTKLRYAPK